MQIYNFNLLIMWLNHTWDWDNTLNNKVTKLPQTNTTTKLELSSQEQFNKNLASELDAIRSLAIKEKIEQWIPVDFTPDRFEFTPMLNLQPDIVIVSNPIIITWINIPVVMKVEEWTVIQNGKDTWKDCILVQNWDKIELKILSPKIHNAEKSVSVDAWWYSTKFIITTEKWLNAVVEWWTIIKNGVEIWEKWVAVNSGDSVKIKMTTWKYEVKADLSIWWNKIN